MEGVAAWQVEVTKSYGEVTERDAPLLWLVLCNVVIGEGSEIELNFVPFIVPF